MHPDQEVVQQPASKSGFLNQNDHLARHIIESAHDLIAVHNLPDLSYEYANPSTIKTLGYTQEELMSSTVFELIHPDDRAMIPTKPDQYRQEDDDAGNVVFRYRKKDGSYIWLDTLGTFLENKSEKQSLIIFSRDITKRKLAEQALQKSHTELEAKIQEKTFELNALIKEMQDEIMNHMHTIISLEKSKKYYQTFFENSGTAIVILDRNLNIININSMFKELTGYSEKELLDYNTWTQILTPESLEIVQKDYYIRKTVPDKGKSRLEVQGFNKNGQLLTMLAQISVVPESSNFIISLLDITEQKKLELLSQANKSCLELSLRKRHLG